MQPTFEEILRAWYMAFNCRLPNQKDERHIAFIELLGNLKKYGFGKEELSSSKKTKIIDRCVNKEYHDKAKLRKWTSIIEDDLENAILAYHGGPVIDFGHATEEHIAKIKAMQEAASKTTKLKTESIPDIEDTEQNPINNKTNETIPLTDDMLADTEGVNAVFDEDFWKNIGAK